MRVFVTGSSGLCGSAVVPLLAERGHHIIAYVRSPESASKVKSWGAHETVLGDLDNINLMAETAAKVDGVIHMGFDNAAGFKPGGMEAACNNDVAVIKSMCDALLASGPASDGKEKVFIMTSGLLGGDKEDETSEKNPNAITTRVGSEIAALEYSKKGLRTMNVRLSTITHGASPEHPFISMPIAKAKENGYVAYIGEGDNLWSAIDVKDAAAVFVLGLEKGPAGVHLHAVDEEGIPFKQIAEFIGKKLNLPVKSVERGVTAPWGFVGIVIGLGGRNTSQLTRKWLDWEPKGSSLFEELEKNYTF